MKAKNVTDLDGGGFLDLPIVPPKKLNRSLCGAVAGEAPSILFLCGLDNGEADVVGDDPIPNTQKHQYLLSSEKSERAHLQSSS